MSYLPDLPTRERRSDLFPPPLRNPAPRPGTAFQPISPDSFWYGVFFLGCAAAALVLWGAYSALPRSGNSGNSLRAEHTVPKLKGEVPAQDRPRQEMVQVVLQPPPPPPMPVETPSQARYDALSAFPKVDVPLPPIKVDPQPPPPIQVAAPSVPMPARTEAQVVFPPVAVTQDVVVPALPPSEPTIFLSRANLGETPMIRNWKTLALVSLIATTPVVVTAPVVAGGQDGMKVEKQVEDLKKQFEDIKGLLTTTIGSIDRAAKGVEGIKSDVGKLQEDVSGLKATKLTLDIELGRTNVKIDNLEKQLGNLQADISFLRRELTKQAGVANTIGERTQVDELKKHLVAIEQAIVKLHPGEPSTANRIALSPPSPMARVLLVNMYHEEMLFVVNQKAYRVAPRSVSTLDAIPAGAVSYEVISPTWGLRDQKTRSISANETLSVTVQ